MSNGDRELDLVFETTVSSKVVDQKSVMEVVMKLLEQVTEMVKANASVENSDPRDFALLDMTVRAYK